MGLFGFDAQFAMFDTTPVANQFILEYMPTARGDYVKVYLYGLMQCYHPSSDMTLEQISHDLNLTMEEVLAAYRHWERRGLVRRVSDNPPQFVYVNVYQQFFNRDATPRDLAYEDFAESLYAAFGDDRKLHGSETTLAYEWVEDMGLPQEVVLMLINYMIANHGKHFSFTTAQKKATELAAAHVQTIEEAEEILSREKKIEEGLKRLIRRFGRPRPASTDERNMYTKWVKEWGFTPEAIEAACVETLNGEPTMKYLNGILQGMRERSGGALTSATQVEKLRQGEQEQYAPLKALLRVMNAPGVSINEGTLELYSQMRQLYPDDIILMAGRACAKVGGDLPDVLTTLKIWKRKGLQTSAQVQASLDQVDRQNTFLSTLYELWGRPGRPSAGDRALLTKWTSELGYNEEMILFCAAYARDAEKPMPYLDKLLTAYHTQGITTPDQVEAARTTFAAEAASNRPAAPAPRRQGKVVGEQQYTQRTYESSDELPAWMQQKIKELKGDA